MHNKQKFMLIGVVIVAFTLACSLSSQQPTATLDQSAVDTMVAETVAAQQPTGDTSDGSGGGDDEPAPTDTVEPTEAPTDTPEPTPTETPTNTPEPTLPQGIEDLNLGPADRTYNFDTRGAFYTYSSADSQVEVKDGTLQFTIFDALPYTIWSFSALELEDFYFEISVKMPNDCVGKDRGGIIFGTPPGETGVGLNYQISCDGQYRLFNYDGSETIELVPWTTSSELDAGPGKNNKIGVIHRGQKITLYINGELVSQVTDDAYEGTGRIGINMGVDNHDNVTIFFDDAAYWTDLP